MKSGFVAILGQPNVGKSTLLNAILKEKVSIVSPKPQTTRNKILGIYNDEESQIVFIDTPGIHNSHNKLDEYMNKTINTAKQDVDVLLYVIDGTKKITEQTIETLNKYTKNIILNTLPITEPSLWKLVPKDTVVSTISDDTPIFLVHSILTGIDAAEEQVPNAVTVAGNIFFQKLLRQSGFSHVGCAGNQINHNFLFFDFLSLF